MEIPEEIIRNRYFGCLAGLVAGNALGIPVEGFKKQFIVSKYGVLRDFDIRPFGRGHFTDDDSEMALAIAESYMDRETCDLYDITKRFVRWMEEDGKGIGISTREVLMMISSGMDPIEASRLFWENSGQYLSGNGALMRCAPTALARLNNPDLLIEETRSIGQITHFAPRSVDSCVFLNTLIAGLIKGEKGDILCSLSCVENEEVIETVGKSIKALKDELGVSGYVLDTLGVAVWIYIHSDDFENGVIEAVNLGGDTDTNGAVVGAILGAKYGVDAIPRRWLDELSDLDRIKNASDGLFKLAFANQ